jgi:hypothetical protein
VGWCPENCLQYRHKDDVRVVRCYQCKHSTEYRCKVDPMRNHLLCRRRPACPEPVEEDGFCYRGERKTE